MLWPEDGRQIRKDEAGAGRDGRQKPTPPISVILAKAAEGVERVGEPRRSFTGKGGAGFMSPCFPGLC